MFGRIQNIDNRVLERIGKIHKPALNRIMIFASRAGNLGLVWWRSEEHTSELQSPR